jgi:hypothetical protein
VLPRGRIVDGSRRDEDEDEDDDVVDSSSLGGCSRSILLRHRPILPRVVVAVVAVAVVVVDRIGHEEVSY